jgi:hypothetical protein
MTENVAVCPTVTVWLAGAVEMDGAVPFGGGVLLPPPQAMNPKLTTRKRNVSDAVLAIGGTPNEWALIK